MERVRCALLLFFRAVLVVSVTTAILSLCPPQTAEATSGGKTTYYTTGGTCSKFNTPPCKSPCIVGGSIWTTPTCYTVSGGCACK